MFKKIALTTVAASTLLISMQASANNYHNKHAASINKEQREQATMISQGIRTCEITPAEARTLRSTQKRIATMESKFKRDGLTRWERQTLNEKLHAARVEINRMTKNRSTCYSKKHSNDRGYGKSKDRRHNMSHSGYSSSKGTISISVRNVF